MKEKIHQTQCRLNEETIHSDTTTKEMEKIAGTTTNNTKITAIGPIIPSDATTIPSDTTTKEMEKTAGTTINNIKIIIIKPN